jgi:SAM-dependent methyltransferase
LNGTVNNAWYEDYFGPDYLLIDLHPNTGQEVEFIWKVLGLGKGMSVLDAGCGYGRHLVPLLSRGAMVIGCDLSGFMLKEAESRIQGELKRNQSARRRSGLVRCDYRALPFYRSFDCAINMFNSYGYFAKEEDNFRILGEIARALKPGGLFLIDLVNRDFVIRHLARKDWFEHDGAVILEKKEFDPIANRTEIDVSVIDKRGKRDYHHSIRLYSHTEMVMLLSAAGFKIVAVFGGFCGETFDLNHDRMLILSRSPEMEDE